MDRCDYETMLYLEKHQDRLDASSAHELARVQQMWWNFLRVTYDEMWLTLSHMGSWTNLLQEPMRFARASTFDPNAIAPSSRTMFRVHRSEVEDPSNYRQLSIDLVAQKAFEYCTKQMELLK